MEFISTEGVLYLPGEFKFTGKIVNGRFEEGVMENYYIKFEGVWGKYYIDLPSNTDEPDYEEVKSLKGTIYRGEYKYVGDFEPEAFYKGKIVSYENVKIYNIDNDEFVKECFIDESSKSNEYKSSYSSYNNFDDGFENDEYDDNKWERLDEKYSEYYLK